MQPLFAIVSLTWKAAFRYRLFWVIMTLLLGAVIWLPLIVKHDGSAEGFAQILITYTLTTVTVLLGLCTLWIACGTLARDVEECQIQMVAVKPIPRWKIWLGKWLGLVSLNAVLLAVVGLCLYGLLEWRARGLSEYELAKLRTQVLVARSPAREQNIDDVITRETDRLYNEQKAKNDFGGLKATAVRAKLEEEVRARLQSVSQSHERRWVIHVGRTAEQLKGEPLYLRIKFNSADAGRGKTFLAFWRIDDPAEKLPPYVPAAMSFSADSFHEFPVPSELLDANGDLEIRFSNQNASTLVFPLDDGMAVLYREAGFGLNLARGMAIILCWMSFFAALGLAAASFLSFPVAAFCCLALLSVGLSSGTMASVVSEGTILGLDTETAVAAGTFIDHFMVPAFRVMLDVINLVQQFSPIDSLSTGVSISWSELGRAAAQIVLLLGGVLALFGILIFNRRELATAQGNL